MRFFAVSGKFPKETFAASLSRHGLEAAHHWDGSKSQSSLTARFSKMPVRLPKPGRGRTWGRHRLTFADIVPYAAVVVQPVP